MRYDIKAYTCKLLKTKENVLLIIIIMSTLMNMVNLNASVKDVRDRAGQCDSLEAGHPGAPPRKGLRPAGLCSGLEGYTPAHYFITRNDGG